MKEQTNKFVMQFQFRNANSASEVEGDTNPIPSKWPDDDDDDGELENNKKGMVVRL